MTNNSGSKPYHLMMISDSPLGEALHATCFLSIAMELKKMGVEVTLVSQGDRSGKKNYYGVEVLFIHAPDVYFLRQAMYHIKILNIVWRNFHQFDVILFNEMATLWLLSLQINKIIKSRKKPLIILDTRSLPMLREDKATIKDRIRAHFSLLMNKFANRWADGRTTITELMAQVLKVPEDKMLGVWPSGVELERFDKARQLRTWPKNGEVIQLVYIGCMHYERNLMALCKAVKRANEMGRLFQLTIVGEGRERHDLEEYSKDIPQIEVLPPVPQEQVSDYLANAHVGILPFPDELIFQVSSPIKLFEYMASGLPILATEIFCHTDVVKDREFAFWAKSSDEQGLLNALEDLWHRQDQLENMGKISFASAPDWSWASSAYKLHQALMKALEKIHD